MATQTIKTSDLSGAPATATALINLNGEAFKLDLTEAELAQLKGLLSEVLGKAQRAQRAARSANGESSTGDVFANGQKITKGAVREWIKSLSMIDAQRLGFAQYVREGEGGKGLVMTGAHYVPRSMMLALKSEAEAKIAAEAKAKVEAEQSKGEKPEAKIATPASAKIAARKG